MGAALALAIMLVVVVGILSLAVNAQGPFQGNAPAGAGSQRPTRPARSGHPGGAAAPPVERPPRRAPRERSERIRDRDKPPAPASSSSPPADRPIEAEVPVGDLKPLNAEGQATVISVVDERTLGPVTRSRLTLRIEPTDGDPFEVTTRVAFPTPEERARVKVGSTIPVRYDPNDHRRVVVEMDKDTGG
ncbi:MAG TPA: hypothetical protein VME46_21300 [Acidimicrobiales bacterium]|nr:hypothetical protein [Acidimicrobiales bacterium]